MRPVLPVVSTPAPPRASMPARIVGAVVGLVVGIACGLVGCDGRGDRSNYRRDGGRWTYEGLAIAPVDAATFRPIDGLFARDAQRGYYRGAAVPDSDGASFEALSAHEARDRLAVWWCDTYRKGQEYWSIRHLRIERIDDADATTYRALGDDYAHDARRVYHEGRPFPVRDVATFVPLPGGFGHDAQRAYHERLEIAGSHGPTFETIAADDPAYARDRAHVYHGSLDPDHGARPLLVVLRDADPATLRVVGRGYAASPSHVWYRGRPLVGADAATFHVDESFVGDSDASDRLGAWSRGIRIVAKATTSSTSTKDAR